MTAIKNYHSLSRNLLEILDFLVVTKGHLVEIFDFLRFLKNVISSDFWSLVRYQRFLHNYINTLGVNLHTPTQNFLILYSTLCNSGLGQYVRRTVRNPILKTLAHPPSAETTTQNHFHVVKANLCRNLRFLSKRSVQATTPTHLGGRNPYVLGFFIGLLDGDGSIQVNHSRRKWLQYRFVIKLSALEKNIEMLQWISDRLVGNVYQKKGFVYWKADHKRDIVQLVQLLNEMPPLTHRLRLQLLFLERILGANDIALFLATRAHKYVAPRDVDYEARSRTIMSRAPLATYFDGWCSGFIEAVGCFTLHPQSEKGTPSFSIAQKDDRGALDLLHAKFGGRNTIRTLVNGLFLWEVYRKAVLQELHFHILRFPLKGAKSESATLFFDRVDPRRNR